jgi:phage terminase small subunit
LRAGYSKKTANRIASENLSKPDIQEYLNKKKEQIVTKIGVTQEQVAEELRRLAFSDLRCLFNENGSLKKISELDEDAARALAGVDVDEITIGNSAIGTTKKVKLWDKLKALEMLGRYFGMFEKDNKQQSSVVGVPLSDAQVDKIIQSLREAKAA